MKSHNKKNPLAIHFSGTKKLEDVRVLEGTKRPVFEILPPQWEITEHQVQTKIYPHGNLKNVALFKASAIIHRRFFVTDSHVNNRSYR